MDDEDGTMRAAAHFTSWEMERPAGGAAAGAAYVLRARRPGATLPIIRSSTSALRVLHMEDAFRADGMTTEIAGADGRRLSQDELGKRACDEATALAGRGGWGWWRRGLD